MKRREAAADRHAATHRANRNGILAMIAAMGCFIVNDTLVKYASQTMPAAQLIFVRSFIASTLILIAARSMGVTVRIGGIARGWVAARAVVDAFATMLFLLALFHLPLANATAINMASPLVITVLSALFIGERVAPSQWLAIVVGFLGVVLIIQPHAQGFNVYVSVCVASTVLIAVRDIITRRVHVDIPSILVTLSNSVAVTLLAGGLSLFEGWRAFSPFEICLLAVAALFLAAGYHLIVTSTRRGDLSVIVPFRYAGLLLATISGFAVWGDTPNAISWCGIGLLVGSGIYVLRAHRRPRESIVPSD